MLVSFGEEIVALLLDILKGFLCCCSALASFGKLLIDFPKTSFSRSEAFTSTRVWRCFVDIGIETSDVVSKLILCFFERVNGLLLDARIVILLL